VIEELVPDELWQQVAPLLPARPPRRTRYPGGLPADDRGALAGIVFVLKTGITWRELPHEVARDTFSVNLAQFPLKFASMRLTAARQS